MGMKEYVTGAGLALALALGASAHADTDAIMKKLRSLEGEWTLLDEQGEDTGQLGLPFSVIFYWTKAFPTPCFSAMRCPKVAADSRS